MTMTPADEKFVNEMTAKLDAAREAQSGASRLWGWFSLSYASFCVLPRILMCAMPDDWQKRMAVLLEEYDEAYPSHPDTDCLVLSRHGQRFRKWPDWLTNYRYPNGAEIEKARRS